MSSYLATYSGANLNRTILFIKDGKKIGVGFYKKDNALSDKMTDLSGFKSEIEFMGKTVTTIHENGAITTLGDRSTR